MSIDLKRMLAEAGIERPSDELVAKREAAFKLFGQKANVVELSQDLIRYLFSLKYRQATLEDFIRELSEADPEFPPKPKAFQIRVLVAAFLCHLLDVDSSELGVHISFAVVNCYSFGLRSKLERTPLVNIAEDALNTKLVRLRYTGKIEPLDTSLNDGNKRLKDLVGASLSTPEEVEKLRTFLRDLIKAIKAHSESLNSVLTNISKTNGLLKEESDILWWLISNTSSQLGQPWTNTKPLDACLAIGKELGDLVRVIPGPRSARELIIRVLASCSGNRPDSTTLSSLISKTPLAFAKATAASSALVSGDFTPVHFAVAQFVQRKSLTEFSKIVKAHKIDLDRRLPLDLFGLQMYRESIMLHQSHIREG